MRELLQAAAGRVELDSGSPGGEASRSCEPSFEGDRLIVDADGLETDAPLADDAGCRSAVVEALTERDVDAIVVRSAGLARTYDGRGAGLLVAAGRFVERVRVHDERLAARCLHDPLGAGRAAAGRAGVIADIAAETGLAEVASAISDYDAAFSPHVAPTVMRSRIAVDPPADGELDGRTELPTGAVVRVYDAVDRDLRTYHLHPPELDLDREATHLLARAHRLLARGGVEGGRRAPGRAVRRVAPKDAPIETLARTLAKHTRGVGVLEDVFADDRVTDVFATAPVDRNPLRVVVDGETMRSNVRLTEDGAAALASRFRRESGRAFSRASPALDATVEAGDDTVRVAGIAQPASEGVAFAFRADDAEAWTLPALVANGTMPPRTAGLLSVAVRRSSSLLVAGPRGAGKTTTLDALLWELAPPTRVVVIEDTPELSVETLQRHGRDVQALRTTTGEEAGLTPVEALRTALRFGDGALVLGEVRGEEAAVLYEAMRVGADSSAVLGTIHGDGAAAVRERVVNDLEVPASSFAATDLIVTLDRVPTPSGPQRRVAGVQEVAPTGEGAAFEALFAREDGALEATGLMDRGESRLLGTLARPGESYAEVLDRIDERAAELDHRANAGLTGPEDVADVVPN